MKLKIGDFLKRRKDAVDVTDGVKYKRATIRINHKGISVRDELDGTQIKTKRQFIISKGQFLLSKIDARNGAFGIVPEELNKGIITGNFWTFDVDQSKVLIDFFKSFTETVSFTDICIRSSSGTTNRKYLDEKKFLDIDIEVPNIEEQAVAISNYYQRREFINSLQNSGVNQRETLANLRQSILQEAIQGKLTESWRANNLNIEPASELLKRIEAEKQQLIADKKIKKEKILPPIGNDEMPFELPEGWIWCKLGNSGYTQTGSTPSKKQPNYYGNFIPFLGPADISNNWMKYPEEGLSQEGIAVGRLIAKNSLMMVCIGGSIGKCNINTMDVSCNQQINTITPILNEAFYIKSCCQSPYFQNEVLTRSSGSATPIINKGKWENIIIPIAPIQEQQEIVEKVNALMALCDELEQQIESSNIQIEQLMQSCLKEVFDYESN